MSLKNQAPGRVTHLTIVDEYLGGGAGCAQTRAQGTGNSTANGDRNVKRWDQPKWPSAGEQAHKMWQMHTVEYYSASKQTNEVLTHAATLQHG